MPLNEFECECGQKFEKIVDKSVNYHACNFCGSEAKRVVKRFSSNFQQRTGNEDIDVLVGSDSDKRWTKIEKRQKMIDKQRETLGTNQVAVTPNGFSKLNEGQIQERREVGNAYDEAMKSGDIVSDL